MEHELKNGKTVVIRKPTIEDAEAIINVISTADGETKFLARTPGEFSVTVEQEREFIKNILDDDGSDWFVAEYDGKVIGQCSVGLVSKYEKYRHRAEVTFVILKDYWGMGIGGKLIQHCIDWCRDKNVSQIELSVVADNTRAINLYEKFGFKVVGVKPNAMRYPDGLFSDEKLMVLEI